VTCAERIPPALLTGAHQSGDVKLLCELYVECGKWQEAFKVADSNSDLLKMVHAQHAAHLVQHDRFEDAMQVASLPAPCTGNRSRTAAAAAAAAVRFDALPATAPLTATCRRCWSRDSARTRPPCWCSYWSALCSNRCVRSQPRLRHVTFSRACSALATRRTSSSYSTAVRSRLGLRLNRLVQWYRISVLKLTS
jgi:hypothetical protein